MKWVFFFFFFFGSWNEPLFICLQSHWTDHRKSLLTQIPTAIHFTPICFDRRRHHYKGPWKKSLTLIPSFHLSLTLTSLSYFYLSHIYLKPILQLQTRTISLFTMQCCFFYYKNNLTPPHISLHSHSPLFLSLLISFSVSLCKFVEFCMISWYQSLLAFMHRHGFYGG